MIFLDDFGQGKLKSFQKYQGLKKVSTTKAQILPCHIMLMLKSILHF